jgi:zinc and cadmium transporter
MPTLLWIIIATLALSAISLIGAITLIFKESVLKKLTVPLVAFSAGALIGGALFHLIPEAIEGSVNMVSVMIWVIIGFTAFLVFEQFIHWHHCHRMPSEHKHPVTYMILFSDGLHNFIDGLAIGAAFLVNPGLGIATTMAVAAHEIPQELGDFGILIHGGWRKSRALMFNFISGLTMIVGGVIAFLAAREINVIFLLPFSAGNFIYIAASDLIPELKNCDVVKRNLLHLASFILGLFLMYLLLFVEVG